MTGPAPHQAQPWPYAPQLLRPELGRYLADASPAAWHRPAGYQGTDPASGLRAAVEGFTAALGDGAELIPHQRGPVPVAQQVVYGLNELALHHSDVTAAAGHDYAPPPETLAVLLFMWRRQEHDVTGWAGILRASGRNT